MGRRSEIATAGAANSSDRDNIVRMTLLICSDSARLTDVPLLRASYMLARDAIARTDASQGVEQPARELGPLFCGDTAYQLLSWLKRRARDSAVGRSAQEVGERSIRRCSQLTWPGAKASGADRLRGPRAI